VGRLHLGGAACSASRHRVETSLTTNRGRLSQGTEHSSTREREGGGTGVSAMQQRQQRAATQRGRVVVVRWRRRGGGGRREVR
jgi:hypothetical protein